MSLSNPTLQRLRLKHSLKNSSLKNALMRTSYAGKVQWGQDGLEYQRELRAD